MSADVRIDALEERIAQLEAQLADAGGGGADDGGGDTYVPTYLTVDPVTLAIGATFAGKIVANQGLDLTAGAFAGTTPNTRKIRYLREDGSGVVVAELFAVDANALGTSIMLLRAIKQTDVALASHSIQAQLGLSTDPSVEDRAYIRARYDPQTGIEPRLEIGATNAAGTAQSTGTLLDHLGRGMFIQTASGLQKLTIRVLNATTIASASIAASGSGNIDANVNAGDIGSLNLGDQLLFVDTGGTEAGFSLRRIAGTVLGTAAQPLVRAVVRNNTTAALAHAGGQGWPFVVLSSK